MKTKILFPLFGALALALNASTGQAATPGATTPSTAKTDKADQLFDDPVIAKGNDFSIKRSQLEDAFTSAKATAAANGVTFSEAERSTLEVRLLNDLIVTKILSAQATDADRQKAREASEKFITDARKQFSSDEAFNTKLRLNKTTLEELRQKLLNEALPSAVLEREMKSQVPVTDDQAKKFYADNPAKFEEPEMVHVAHILIGTRNPATGAELTDDQKAAKRKQAEDLLKRVKAGENFGTLARQYSEDPGSKDNGGEYTFPRGQMVPPFEAAAFSLKPGEVSSIVTTDFGYHIIKTIEKKPARTVPYSEVSDKIKDYLVQQQAAKIAPGYFAKLKKQAGVEIVDADLKAADIEVQKAAQAAADAKSDASSAPAPKAAATTTTKPAKP